VPAVLTDLAAGHVFPPIIFSVQAEQARAYGAAVGDTLGLYEDTGVVPPLAVAALALGALLEQVSLPPGTLHATESLSFKAPVPAGAALECRATLAQRSQRSGWIVSVLDTEVSHDGAVAITARATVLSPVSLPLAKSCRSGGN
jgi:acyl dehydratase